MFKSTRWPGPSTPKGRKDPPTAARASYSTQDSSKFKVATVEEKPPLANFQNIIRQELMTLCRAELQTEERQNQEVNCIYSQSVWIHLSVAREEEQEGKGDLVMLWLANVYGSIPHKLVETTLEWQHVPRKIEDYYGNLVGICITCAVLFLCMRHNQSRDPLLKNMFYSGH